MFSVLSSRRIAATVAGAALLSLTAACGGSGDTALCGEAKQLMTSYTSSMAANVGDPKKFNDANQKFADDLKALAGKADGDLASALNDLSSTFGAVKLDAKDPAATAASVQDLGKKAAEAGAKLGTACPAS
ncbi:hypothetical protein [Streptosporangium sp. NPDC000396]|uniref:hypothetical protein n=1 Tax=Streptosporangium sp. NPDC000396 TaxID=3366185 RepID=UPI00368CA407